MEPLKLRGKEFQDQTALKNALCDLTMFSLGRDNLACSMLVHNVIP